LQNQWYRVWIKTERNNYYLKIAMEDEPDEERLPYEKFKA
jgi:hypothetical protein